MIGLIRLKGFVSENVKLTQCSLGQIAVALT